MSNNLIPIHFPNRYPVQEGGTWLAADFGGTKTDMALFKMENGHPVLKKDHRYSSKAWNSMADIVKDFCKNGEVPKRLSISFAGPISKGKAQGTNLHWGIDSQLLQEYLNMEHVFLLNDLEANCYGLAALDESDLKTIYAGKNPEPGNAAMISPGTGLGEGGLYWDGQAFRPFATEGGHAHFAPRNEQDWRLFKYLSNRYGHVSWERVASGIGITNIFEFLRDVEQMEVPGQLEENYDPPSISQAAGEGVAIGQETLRLFSRYLAKEAANVAMKFKATGGLFIGGGILPKIWSQDHQDIFSEYFFAVGRMFPLVESVPVSLILNQKTAVLGAAYYGAYA